METESDWSIIPTVEDDGTISSSRIVRNLGSESLEGLTTIVQITIVLDGKREVRDLDQRADDIVDSFENRELLDVCRWFDTDRWRWSGYVAPAVADRLLSLATTTFGVDDAEITDREDPDAAVYQSELEPTADERHTGSDVLLLTALVQQGDRLTESRTIDHVLTFGRPDQATAAAEVLDTKGFDVANTHIDDDDGSATVELREDATPSVTGLRAQRRDLLAAVAEFEPTYDGWGCPVVSAVKKPRRRLFRR